MQMRKIGENQWHYSGNLAWQLKARITALYGDKVDKVEWLVATKTKRTGYICQFVANCYHDGIIIARLAGKGIHDGSHVHVVISEQIEYL